VRYERRVAFHAVITRWGGLPWQEQWVVLVGAGGEVLERSQAAQMPDVRPREGLYQMPEELEPELRERWLQSARETLEALAEEREREWAVSVGRLRDDELERLGAFFSARIEEEEERQRRRAGHDEHELEHGDATSLKLEWERRAAEVRQRWEMRTEVRLWGIEEWSWPVTDLDQELRSGAMHLKVRAAVDVARGRPALPPCPNCGRPAEMLVRAKGTACCAACAPA
jgi:truncated hemoglobin YjbI